MADGFLGRWSRRKLEVQERRPVEEPVPAAAASAPVIARAPAAVPPRAEAAQPSPAREASVAEPAPQAPPPTLNDVRGLTPQSDFRPFMAREVDPEVKNAAMKKLFADPHFNVMDGMDVYIDDYSKPDPLPMPMLRKLASAQFLKLFDEEEEKAPVPPQHLAPPVAEPAPAAARAVAADQPEVTAQDHDNADLRLQQDHAAGPEGPGHGTQ